MAAKCGHVVGGAGRGGGGQRKGHGSGQKRRGSVEARSGTPYRSTRSLTNGRTEGVWRAESREQVGTESWEVDRPRRLDAVRRVLSVDSGEGHPEGIVAGRSSSMFASRRKAPGGRRAGRGGVERGAVGAAGRGRGAQHAMVGCQGARGWPLTACGCCRCSAGRSAFVCCLRARLRLRPGCVAAAGPAPGSGGCRASRTSGPGGEAGRQRVVRWGRLNSGLEKVDERQRGLGGGRRQPRQKLLGGRRVTQAASGAWSPACSAPSSGQLPDEDRVLLREIRGNVDHGDGRNRRMDLGLPDCGVRVLSCGPPPGALAVDGTGRAAPSRALSGR